jgi:four helix bundle protein
MGTIKSFRDLDAWRVGMDLVLMAYERAKLLPATERFELAAQMRRAAVSVPSNVAEGQSVGTAGRYLFHVRVALGSVGELVTHFELAKRLHYLSPETIHEVEAQLERTGQLLHGLARSIRLKRFATVTAWLALLAGFELWPFGLPVGREFRLGVGVHDVLALPLAAVDFVLAWIHVDVLAH